MQNPEAECLPIEEPEETESMFQALFAFFRQLVAIPEHDQALCRQYFKPVRVKKDTILESAGTVHRYHNFLVTGYMRNYYLDADDKEITTDINDGPRFFTSYHSFIQQTVTQDNLHCITDCTLLRITREDNEIVASQGETSQQYVGKILEHYLESSRQRIIDLNTLTAKERYLKLVKHHPAIIQHVPINHIASYLGINPGSLSRIRQEIAS
ncbi:MAG: Crp/Fnr family transcriptional regulator [Bacteroidota bacterium]